MEQQTVQTIKEKLSAEKKHVEETLAGFAHKDAQVDGDYETNFPDYGDSEEENASEVADYTDRLSLEHALEKQLRDINRALESIDAGTYGVCKYCGNNIEEARLLVRPTSSSCVSCKKRLQGE